MSVIIRSEIRDDWPAVAEIHRLAFGREDEARLVDELRSDDYARVSLVAEELGQLVGHILFSRLPIHTKAGVIEAVALAPLGVLPSHQRKGIGSSLVRDGLRACCEAGHCIIIVLGHPDYYPRFGFSANRAERLKSPYAGDAFMALELITGALDGVEGVVSYPAPFEAL